MHVFNAYIKGMKGELTSIDFSHNGFQNPNMMGQRSLAIFSLCLYMVPKSVITIDLRGNDIEFYTHDALKAFLEHLPKTVQLIHLSDPDANALSIEDHLARCQWPASYDELIKPHQHDLIKMGGSLLEDYSKGDSWFLRAVTFHWSRHHVDKVVDIVGKIKDDKFSSPADLIKKLDSIEIKNPAGSLSRRISFFKYQVHQDSIRPGAILDVNSEAKVDVSCHTAP